MKSNVRLINILKENGITVLLIILLAIPLFYNLGRQPIRMWDESRLAINACEMYRNNDWIVTHYGEKPDMWNTKPPLMIWAQVIAMKLFGVNEFAVRLPSAIAGLLLIVILIFVISRHFRSKILFIIASFILVTSQGFTGHHVTRTGDYDALLILFTTLFNFSFFFYLEEGKVKNLYYTFIFLSLAVLTKSIVGLIFLPALFLYAIAKRKLLQILKNKHFYLGSLLFLVVVAGYYLFRELKNPGYLNAVYGNELGGRYLDVTEMHNHSPLFYYRQIFQQFSPWYILAPAGVLIGFFLKEKKIRNLTLFLVITAGFFFVIISTAKTKLIWYDAPIYPSLAIFASIPVYYLYNRLNDKIAITDNPVTKYLPYVLLIVIFMLPYKKIFSSFRNTYEQVENASFYHLSDYLRKANCESDTSLNGSLIIYNSETVAHVQFYINLLAEKGIHVSLTTFPDINSHNKVIVAQKSTQDLVETFYNYELIEGDGIVRKYRLLGRNEKELPGKVVLKESWDGFRIYEEVHE
jgi:4-amino-4-deoxy-L-arabinose transferase-like glycosyltransferase